MCFTELDSCSEMIIFASSIDYETAGVAAKMPQIQPPQQIQLAQIGEKHSCTKLDGGSIDVWVIMKN